MKMNFKAERAAKRNNTEAMAKAFKNLADASVSSKYSDGTKKFHFVTVDDEYVFITFDEYNVSYGSQLYNRWNELECSEGEYMYINDLCEKSLRLEEICGADIELLGGAPIDLRTENVDNIYVMTGYKIPKANWQAAYNAYYQSHKVVVVA